MEVAILIENFVKSLPEPFKRYKVIGQDYGKRNENPCGVKIIIQRPREFDDGSSFYMVVYKAAKLMNRKKSPANLASGPIGHLKQLFKEEEVRHESYKKEDKQEGKGKRKGKGKK
jgi:hypothetical protein